MTAAQTDRLTGLVGYTGVKVPVKAATTAAITLSGEQTIDGVAVVTDDRVLVKDQADPVANGIYIVDTGAWSRAPDADGAHDWRQGSVVLVYDGIRNAAKLFKQKTAGEIVVGTSSLRFEELVADENWTSNLCYNGDFSLWTTEPASGSVTAAAGVGFVSRDICDGWYGGPGGGGTITFSRGTFDPGQTDVAGYPWKYSRWDWTVAPTSGSWEYSTAFRNTYIEHAVHDQPQMMLGKLAEVSFDARCDTGTLEAVPVLWISTGISGWLTGQNKTANVDYVQTFHDNALYVYKATSTGVTGGVEPVHLTGTQSDGGVNWLFVGKAKGRTYDIYESGPNVLTGTVYASSHEGTPHTGAACTVTTTFQRFKRYIKLPPGGYVNTLDYTGDVTDASRTLLPWTDQVDMGGSFPYSSVGLDVVGNPGTNALEVANVKVRVIEDDGEPFHAIPRRLLRLLTNDLEWLLADAQKYVWCGTAGGTANAITLTPTVAVEELSTGLALVFKSGAAANTGATTLAVSGLTAKAVQSDGNACVGGEIQASKWYRVTYDGAAFQLEQLAPAVLLTGTQTIAGAKTFSSTVALGAGANVQLTNGQLVGWGDLSVGLEGDGTGETFKIKVNNTDYITITSGGVTGVRFNASQVDSANANTLDDYEEGTCTWTVTFVTPGDLSVVYGTRVGTYVKIGRQVITTIDLELSTFTHTTASGSLQITGAPFASQNTAGLTGSGAGDWQGITKANYTDVVARIAANTSTVTLQASGSAQTRATIAAADMPTTGAVQLHFTLPYSV